VTGASRGIGAEISRQLGRAGARVALVARTGAALEKLAEEIGNDAVAIIVDLSIAESARVAAETARDAFGEVPDVLVNNAGIFRIDDVHEMEIGSFSEMLQTNLLGPFALIRALLPAMRARGTGHIVTVGSVADRAIFPGNAAYSASKFGMRAIHEVMREETRGTGVRASLISPAGVDTGMWDGVQLSGAAEPPDRTKMLHAGDVAAAVLFALTQPAHVNIDELRLSRS
jgi:NADP-dependent 3-hydroxy acid dehydrogenase YdfG